MTDGQVSTAGSTDDSITTTAHYITISFGNEPLRIAGMRLTAVSNQSLLWQSQNLNVVGMVRAPYMAGQPTQRKLALGITFAAPGYEVEVAFSDTICNPDGGSTTFPFVDAVSIVLARPIGHSTTSIALAEVSVLVHGAFSNCCTAAWLRNYFGLLQAPREQVLYGMVVIGLQTCAFQQPMLSPHSTLLLHFPSGQVDAAHPQAYVSVHASMQHCPLWA